MAGDTPSEELDIRETSWARTRLAWRGSLRISVVVVVILFLIFFSLLGVLIERPWWQRLALAAFFVAIIFAEALLNNLFSSRLNTLGHQIRFESPVSRTRVAELAHVTSTILARDADAVVVRLKDQGRPLGDIAMTDAELDQLTAHLRRFQPNWPDHEPSERA